MKKISIIIPCKKIDSMTIKCIVGCLNLDYSNFEIIVLPDKEDFIAPKKFPKKVKIIETGEVKPAFKRNFGMKKAKGAFFAFIDSDAYPKKDWLKNAVRYLENKEVGIIGGPNLTPLNVNFWEKVSGHVLSNFLVSGKADIRYKKAKNQNTYELPSCNYISKKEASSEYDSCFLTAEDSEFCFNCIKKGYKVFYASDVVVYHHRRDSFRGHLKQMWIYARDIAWLTKKDFSWNKMYYSILSWFVIGFFVLGISAMFNNIARIFFLTNLFFYFLIILLTSIHKNFKITLAVTITSMITHFAYGLGWLYGIFSNQKQQKYL
jgi:cellulose synthase/poly-beta-1,6-N-acetylglucosamine synthase-like glycosyltransferase